MKSRPDIYICAILLFCLFLFPISAGSARGAPQGGISLDFENVDIHTFIKYISEATGHNFIPDPAVKGNVTVYSPVKITPEEAFETFVSMMRVHGYSVQKSGRNWKIVPMKDAMGQGSEINASGRRPLAPADSIVTQIVQLKVGVASEIAKVLPSLLGLRHILHPIRWLLRRLPIMLRKP